MTVIHTPPGFDRRGLLGRLNSTALEHSPEYRRAITRTSPMLFGLTYLLHHLRSPETGGEVSLSPVHIALARSARRWLREDLAPGEVRDAVVAPRGAAKSTWTLLVNPMWALAHQHRRFAAFFADSGPQARQHLATLKRELDDNALLRLDFPDLCEPARLRGRSDQDTQVNYAARSGAAIMAKGIDSAVLGAKHGGTRPDLICADDLEPTGSKYSAAGKEKRLATLVDGVLGLNPNAVVQLAGTVVMRGSIMHDLVMSAIGQPAPRWVADERFRVLYFPAIVVDDDGRERSLWPQRWSLEYLQSIRHTRSFALNFQNLPAGQGEGFWSEPDIRVDPSVRVGPRVLVIDPAVTHGPRSDFTGLAVVGREVGGRRAVIDHARGVRVSPDDLKRIVDGLLGANRTIRRVRVEKTQGGETWRSILAPTVDRHPGVELDLFDPPAGKDARFTAMLDLYQRGLVVHSRELPQLTEQQLAYPNVPHDDVLDAACAGVEHWMPEEARIS